MMMLLKQLGIEDWHKVHVDNLGLWIDKVAKLKPYQWKKHVVFDPANLDRELEDIKNTNLYKSKLEFMLKVGRSRANQEKRKEVVLSDKREEQKRVDLNKYVKSEFQRKMTFKKNFVKLGSSRELMLQTGIPINYNFDGTEEFKNKIKYHRERLESANRIKRNPQKPKPVQQSCSFKKQSTNTNQNKEAKNKFADILH